MSGIASSNTKAADLLLRAQVISRPVYDQVVAITQQENIRAEEVLLDQNVMREAELLKALSSIYRTQFVSTEKLSKADVPRGTFQLIPRRVAETLTVFPVLFDRQKSVLSIVTADPDNANLLKDIKLVSGANEVKAFVARPAAIAAMIRKHHGGDARAFELLERSSFEIGFGQQVNTDGRVLNAKESRTLGEMAPQTPQAFAPSSAPMRAAARSTPDEEEAALSPRNPPPVRQSVARDRPSVRQSMARDPMRQSGAVASLSLPPAPPTGLPPPVPTRAAPPPTPRSFPASVAPQMSQAPRGQAPPLPPSARQPAPSQAAPPMTAPPPSDVLRANVLSNDTTIELLTVLVSLLENSRQELRGHSSQVARLLRRVAERMNLDRSETYAVIVAGHIHDIGKMGQFHLTALNCSEYEGHRVAAQKAHDTPLRLLEAVRLTPPIRNAVFHMYERFDGNGFPDKLVGKEIPLSARLLAVADTYADLTQNPRNPFRKVLGPSEAMGVLAKQKGTTFDPGILDLFRALVLGEDMRAKLLADRAHVLIVDADPEESTVLELRMVEQGFDVKTARSTEAARKLLSSDSADFDMVVCEVELPDADGLAFLSEVRKESWGRDLPWVVHTRKQGRTEAQRAFELGAMDFVAKPMQTDVLVAKLKAMLDQSKNAKSGAKGVSGSLKEMGLPDIVQVLFHGRKTGRLNVRSGGSSGEIHFLDGAIANALHNGVTGAKAFYAMLRFEEGDFALDPSFTPPKRLIEESSEALLLEGMRRMDEGLE